MRNFLSIFLLFICSNLMVVAQTWTGTTDTDWSKGTNWNGGVVPVASGNVTIPGAPVNQPRLAGAITVNTLTLQAGSSLDVNGFNVTTTGSMTLNGASIDNSGLGAIVLEAGGGSLTIHTSTFKKAVEITTTGNAILYEAYGTGANSYLANATFRLAGTGAANLSTAYRSAFGGDLLVERTVAGTTNLFTSSDAASTAVAGNFTYHNHVGGASVIGGTAGKSNFNGAVTIDVSAADTNPAFTLRRIDNTGGSGGGSVSVVNPGTINVLNDTLNLTSFTVVARNGNASSIGNNVLEGSFTYSDVADNSSSLSTYGNVFDGAASFSLNGASTASIFYESNSSSLSGNVYKGNAVFSTSAGGALNIGYSRSVIFQGNLSVTRAVLAAATNILTNGGSVDGDFSYTNEIGGATTIGDNGQTVPVAGKVDILTDFAGDGNGPVFNLYGIQNETGGGEIEIKKSGAVTILNNSLIADEIKLLSKNGNASSIGNNVLEGNFTFSDVADNSQALNTYGNVFDGTASFSLNGASTASIFYESNASSLNGNVYKGNAVFSTSAGGALHIGYSRSVTFEGNLSVTRSVLAAATNILTNGGNIDGDFSYTNEIGGATTIGQNGLIVPVAGKVDILTDFAGDGNGPVFNLYGIQNETGGGEIEIKKSGAVTILNNSLIADEIKLLSKNGNASSIGNNVLEGNFTFSDVADNSGALNTYGNVFDGATSFSLNGTSTASIFYESSASSLNGNVYKGDASFVRSGNGAFNLSYSRVPTFHKNVTVHTASGLTFYNPLRFAGNSNGILTQAGAQPLQLVGLAIDKSDNARLVLASPVNTTGTVNFVNGYLEASETNYLNFSSNAATHTGAGSQSHAVGTVRKTGTNAFTFPVGNGLAYHPVSISAPGGGTSHVFSAEYRAADAVNYDPENFEAPLEKVSDQGYWDVKRLTGSNGVFLKLAYNVPPGFISQPDDLHVAHWTDGSWKSKGGVVEGDNTSGTIETANAVTDFSPFAIATINAGSNPLPVKLVEFLVSNEGNTGQLRWATASEHNSAHFEVEHSRSATVWSTLGRVSAKGESAVLERYAFTHALLSAGQHYYRLKMVDSDGSFEYSEIRSLNAGTTPGDALSVFPNPAIDRITLNTSDSIRSVQVFDATGRLHPTKGLLGGKVLDISGLASGLYFVKVEFVDNTVKTGRVVIGRP